MMQTLSFLDFLIRKSVLLGKDVVTSSTCLQQKVKKSKWHYFMYHRGTELFLRSVIKCNLDRGPCLLQTIHTLSYLLNLFM